MSSLFRLPVAAVAASLLSVPIGACECAAAPPKATSLFPSGGGRGQAVEVTVDGSFENWPVKTWSNESGLAIEPGSEKGKLTIEVAADAPPGVRWIRLFDDEGATSPLSFEIGMLPAMVESEPNDKPVAAQALAQLPIVIDGRLDKRGDVDGYAVALRRGQTLVASIKGHRLGAPMDAVLQIVSPAGFVLQQSDDELGLDPQMAFEVPDDGTYIVRCFAFLSEPTSTIGFAGGEKFLYRLTLTTDGFVDHTLPLTLSADGTKSGIEGFGWNLPEDAQIHPENRVAMLDRVRIWHDAAAQVIELPVLPVPSVVETTAAGPAEPQQLAPPVIVSGRIAGPGEIDLYRFPAKKGQEWRLRVVARQLFSQLDPQLRITDEQNKVVAEQDDAERTARDVDLRFQVAADGNYLVSVGDLIDRGGLRFFYRLEITEPTPDFRLTLATDQIAIRPGTSATIDVAVDRLDGLGAPIEILVQGLPDGIEAAPQTVETAEDNSKESGRGRKQDQPPAKLTLTAGDRAEAFSGPVTIVGRALREDTSIERVASASLSRPDSAISELWLTVTRPSN